MSWIKDLIGGQVKISKRIDDLERKLTKQMSCRHQSILYSYTSFLNICSWQKECRDCGLDMGNVSSETKIEEQLESARKEVTRLERALGEKGGK